MIKCLAVDDETPALEILEDNIRQVPFLQLVKKCKNAYAAIEVLKEEPIDLLFLDIEMPGINGLDFLKSLTDKPMVIFITAYKNYAVEGFDLDVLDYLIKPVAFNRFLKAAVKALEYQKFKEQENAPSTHFPDYIFVHTEYQLKKVFLHEITYIESLRNYVKIHITTTARPIVSKLSMKAIEEKLPAGKFARVHKSFIVMLDKIGSIRNDTIQIGETEIPVSRSYREEFFKKINEKNIKEE
jgi:DNA-binding LytR/AlgR family response regulator